MRIILLSLLLILICGPIWAQDESLQNFETDYCTFFANGTIQEPDLWKHCCFEHDLRYWFGGALDDRDIADTYLKQCVQDVAGSFWANLIYTGVREGHKSPIQNRLHWGWGWTSHRENLPLTNPEKKIIQVNLYQLNLDQDYVENFIRKYKLN